VDVEAGVELLSLVEDPPDDCPPSPEDEEPEPPSPEDEEPEPPSPPEVVELDDLLDEPARLSVL
jgi:hypothetical protein